MKKFIISLVLSIFFISFANGARSPLEWECIPRGNIVLVNGNSEPKTVYVYYSPGGTWQSAGIIHVPANGEVSFNIGSAFCSSYGYKIDPNERIRYFSKCRATLY